MNHSPGPWRLSGPMGTGHLKGEEPWFYVSAERTLFLRIEACSDGYVRGENEANARLIHAALEMRDILIRASDAIEVLDGTSVENEKLLDDYRALMARLA